MDAVSTNRSQRLSLTPVLSTRRWLRGLDLNQRPSGYEPDELPDCSTPRQHITRLIALPQPHSLQVPVKCPEFGRVYAQTAPYARSGRERKCSELLKCCRAPIAW